MMSIKSQTWRERSSLGSRGKAIFRRSNATGSIAALTERREITTVG